MSTQGDKLKAIADAIRAKEGSSDPIVASDFPARIAAIETGIDTSDATATDSDIASGKTAYVNGQKVTGNVSVITGGGAAEMAYSNMVKFGSTVYVNGRNEQNRLLRVGAVPQVLTPLTEFGNATAADVVAGKTFTSTAGVKVTGTAASMPAMATVTVNIGSTSWTNTDIFAPFDYLSIGSLPFDPSAARVSSPATFQVPVGGAFGIAAGSGGVKPISITGGRIIIDSEGTDGCHYSMIVVESASCYITMGLT